MVSSLGYPTGLTRMQLRVFPIADSQLFNSKVETNGQYLQKNEFQVGAGSTDLAGAG